MSMSSTRTLEPFEHMGKQSSAQRLRQTEAGWGPPVGKVI